ncbi:hypothetical protein BX666DRAFT_1854670 [Dichotomocladium elegans]|nr:hypothetical protein BX666DRAFT_1854670 [Dichotomocladium elegans]
MSYQDSEEDDTDTAFDEDEMSNASCYQNTYFMDGGNRFISLPTLGNSNTKAASFISRVFEDWLEQKIYGKQEDDPTLPILEDSVECVANQILGQLKQHAFPGISKALVKVRTGHVYTYHQLENGQPLITEDMEGFFQQFPLFVEVTIRTSSEEDDNDMMPRKTTLLLMVENITVNPGNPYRLTDHISASS